MRQQKDITLNSVTGFKNQLLSWSQQFEEIVWLDSNQCIQSHATYDAVSSESESDDESDGLVPLEDGSQPANPTQVDHDSASSGTTGAGED